MAVLLASLNVAMASLLQLVATTIALLSFLLAAAATVPEDAAGSPTILNRLLDDIRTGSFIAVTLALLLVAVSTLLTHAFEASERKELTVTLTHMGVPRRFVVAVTVWETVIPLVMASLSGFAVGWAVFPGGELHNGGAVVAVYGVGVALVFAAPGVAEVLRHRCVLQHHRPLQD